MARVHTFESLAIRDYRLLWLGQVSTSMGQWMDQVTRGWLIYQLTSSPLQLGLATATRGLPILFFGIVAGAFADRSGRKTQLVVAQVVNAALNVVLAALVFTGAVEPWHVYVTGFLAGTVQAFQQPARQTLVSDVVGNDKLLNALALNSAALNGSRTLGPAVAGAVIVAAGVDGSYFLQAAMYAIATMWTIQMHVPVRSSPERGGRPRESFFASIWTGLRFAAAEHDIRTLLVLALGPLTFGMSYSALMPVIAQDVLHGGAALQGMLLSFIGFGSLAGALIVASIKRRHAYGLPVVLGAVAFSASLAGFASSHWVLVSCALGMVLGLFNVTYTTQNQTLLQIIAPPHLRGRVMSLYLLSRGLVPVSALIAGAVAAQFGGPNALRIMSGIALAIIATVVVSSPRILRLKVPLTASDAGVDRAVPHLAGPTILPDAPAHEA